jgi:hypothetical protein
MAMRQFLELEALREHRSDEHRRQMGRDADQQAELQRLT